MIFIIFKRCVVSSLMGALLLFAATALGATIRVPADQSTIQAGIDAASAGDTVLVADGTYTGTGNKNLDFKGKAITVQSENGAGNCIIDCEEDGRGFYFHSGEGANSVLSGFRVCNGNANMGGGIFCYMSSPSIINCTISNNASESGGGIKCYQSSPTIKNCTISENTVTVNGGGGIECNDASPTITNCIISYNSAVYSGGIACNNLSSAIITDCTISHNTAENRGGIGTWSSSPTIRNCIISNNKATDSAGSGAGGIGCYSDSSAIIDACTISNNTAPWGGGIKCYQSSSTITNCLIVENTVTGGGGSISCHSSSPTITNCTSSGNKVINTSGAGGILCTNASSPILKNSIFWENSFAEIETYDSNPVFTYCDVQGGYTGKGNIDSDPFFLGSGNYRLKASSPCINAGTSSGAPATDIDGTSRPQGGGYDMGAYEYTTSTCPDCSGGVVTLQNITFPSGAVCQCTATISITLGVGVTVPDGATVTFKAPQVTVQSGFQAKEGSTVYIVQE